jgi:hypothetical protein
MKLFISKVMKFNDFCRNSKCENDKNQPDGYTQIKRLSYYFSNFVGSNIFKNKQQ